MLASLPVLMTRVYPVLARILKEETWVLTNLSEVLRYSESQLLEC